GSITVSGDLYKYPWFWIQSYGNMIYPKSSSYNASPITDLANLKIWIRKDIPIYPRNRYYSYLKVTDVKFSSLWYWRCNVTLTVEEFVYNKPPSGSFNGSFNAAPTRTLKIILYPETPLPGQMGPFFKGKVYGNNVEIGTFTMSWVSSYFRKATLEVDTLIGAVAPQPVPAASGTGTEDFRTIFEAAGWNLKVVNDQTDIPVPAGVNANQCWSNSDLHDLMTNVRKASTNLDKEWRLHLVVVPGRLGCGRGIMYDQIVVHREGVMSYSDDGYSDTEFGPPAYGAAMNQTQRNVPRAFLRSAAHEVGHGFNQVHQSAEGGNDNSIMTTSGGVANVLGGPATGEPGVFPNNINLSFNEHNRHHLVHSPDPAVRPGAMNWATSHTTTVPEADEDRQMFNTDELELKIKPITSRLKLGEPLPLSWELVNKSKEAISAPTDIRIETQLAHISVTSPNGELKSMPTFVIETDSVLIEDMKPQEKREAETILFWSSNGFAFDRPGKHTIDLRILWNDSGLPCGVKASTHVSVDYPISDDENEIVSLLMNNEVGKYVSLGGNAKHLKEAVTCIEKANSKLPDHPGCKCIQEIDHKKEEKHK
ncbi:MAG: hypothetical protein O6761_02055, partial [Thaumarchaeota archaeon]|nr:hypothetical protein [Nitrososphaerota archaeon]